MEEFLNSLYNYEYFGFYLIISIIVLVILFLIILFFGKKDQKVREIEATKKLQQINSEAFKEEDNKEKLEINPVNQEKLENDTIILPSIEDVPSINNEEINNEIPEPVLPVQEIKEEPVAPIKEEVKPEVIEPTQEEVTPLLERVEEKPFAFDNTDIFNVDFTKVEEPQVKEEVKPVIEEVEVPEFNFDEIVKEVEEVKKVEPITNKGPQIFSSVYVPEQNNDIELPKIEKHEEKVSDMEIELPTLKKEDSEIKEEKMEMPVLNDYNLDDLSGETYTINK